jgi:soluble lytic murein transglycosylase-like protein
MVTPREAWQNSEERQGYSGARLRPADYGSAGEAIGRAAQGFGQDLTRVAADLTEIQKRDAETAAREADNMRLAKRLKRYYEGPEGYFNQEGKNALLDRERLDEDLKRIDDEAAALLANKPFARSLFDDMTLKRNTDDMPRIALHESKERNKFEDQVDADAFDLAIDAATSAEDPVAIERNLVTVADIAERQAKRKGMSDPNSVLQARQSATGKAVEAIAQKLELQSPEEAQAFVIAHAGQMDPQDAGKLLASLAAPAAQERAGSEIGQFLVVQGQTAPTTPADAPPAASAGPTLIPPDAVLDAAMFTAPNSQESGGKHIDPKTGRLLESSAGALGISQAMPASAADPGYGVKPLQNQSREEYLRFGRDLRNAYIKHFGGNVVLGLTAYNWGPGNVEAHLKKIGYVAGQTSDAAFINSIPVKEAREYAPSVLNKAGIPVSGVAGPNAGRPVQVGQEIDLDATINNIRNSDRSWVDKQALIAEATRLHGYGRQVKAEAEERLTDDVWTAVNGLKSGFTDYNQLPLSLRTRMERTNPRLAASMKEQAESNKNSVLSAKGEEAQLDLLELQFASPEAFATQIDFRTQYPELNHSTRTQMMERQEAIRKSMEGAGEGRIDYDAMRKSVNQFKGAYAKDKDLGPAYDLAIRKAEAWIRENSGKTLPDAVREGIAREVMMPVTVQRPGTFGLGTRSTKVSRAELEAEIRRGGKPRNMRVDPREQVRAELQQVWGRTPTEDEVTREVQLRTQRGTYSR